MKYILILVIFLIGTGSGLCSDLNKNIEWSPADNYNNIQQYETPSGYNQRTNFNNPYFNEFTKENVQYQPYSPTTVREHQYNLGLQRPAEFGTHPNYYTQPPKAQTYVYMMPPHPSPRTPSFSNPSYSSYPTHLPLQQEVHKTNLNPTQTYPSHNMPLRQGNYNNNVRHSQIQYDNYMPFNGYQRNNYYPGNSDSLAAPDLPVLGPNNFYTPGYKSGRNLNGYSVPDVAPRGNDQQYYMHFPGSSAKPFDMTYQYVYPTK